MKSCTKSDCSQINPQPLDCFGNDKTRSDGKFPNCRSCAKRYREANKEKRNQQKREWEVKNKEHIKEYSKEYYEKIKTDPEYKERRASYMDNYSKKNRKELNSYLSSYRADRIKKDINFKITLILRKRFWRALSGNFKAGSAVNDLGCSIPEFRNYLESKFKEGMSWDNHGDWHIDHIVAISKFDLSNPEEVKKACHYSNLRPLWAQDNLKKGAA